MEQDVAYALHLFTQRYIALWQQIYGHAPASSELYDIASPCIVATRDNQVLWLPQQFSAETTLVNVERALSITLQPAIVAFYTSQFAGDMAANFGELKLSLLQVWSPEDFVRLQENLIGHLVAQRRRRLSPTLFLATTNSDIEVISLCNLSGQVILEQIGGKKRTNLADSLYQFIVQLQPEVN